MALPGRHLVQVSWQDFPTVADLHGLCPSDTACSIPYVRPPGSSCLPQIVNAVAQLGFTPACSQMSARLHSPRCGRLPAVFHHFRKPLARSFPELCRLEDVVEESGKPASYSYREVRGDPGCRCHAARSAASPRHSTLFGLPGLGSGIWSTGFLPFLVRESRIQPLPAASATTLSTLYSRHLTERTEGLRVPVFFLWELYT